MNAATGFRAAGRYEEAEAAYREAEKVYASLLEEPDYRLAGLHNNLSLLYAETGRLSEAEKRGLKALDMIRRLPDAQAECATTLTNLGNICFKMHRTARGARYMKEAAALFETFPEIRIPITLLLWLVWRKPVFIGANWMSRKRITDRLWSSSTVCTEKMTDGRR